MKRLVCEMCGGTDLVKDGEVYVCQRCGCMYLIEGARAVAVEEDAREAEEAARESEELANRIVEKISDISCVDWYFWHGISLDGIAHNSYNEDLEAHLATLSSLDSCEGIEWYIKALLAGRRSTTENDRFEEALDCADRAFRTIAEKLPDASGAELRVLGLAFDLPVEALAWRFWLFAKRRYADRPQLLDRCSGPWLAKTCALYSSWGGHYAGKREGLLAVRETDKECMRKLSYVWDVLESSQYCEGMVRRRCAQDFMKCLTSTISHETEEFGKESGRVRDDLFGAEASSAEEALFTGHIALIEDVERHSCEVTKRLLEEECIDAFVSLHNKRQKSRDDCFPSWQDMILKSYAITVRTCTARRDDCSKRVVEHGVFSDESPSWVVDADGQARIDAQIEELLEQMIEIYWKGKPDDRRAVDKTRENIERIDAEIESMKSATCPHSDGSAADEASANLIGACRKEIESARREIAALGLFGFKRKDELRSRIEELQRTVADEKAKVDERARKEQEAFEAYRSERLKSLENDRKEADRSLNKIEQACRGYCHKAIRDCFQEAAIYGERWEASRRGYFYLYETHMEAVKRIEKQLKGISLI